MAPSEAKLRNIKKKLNFKKIYISLKIGFVLANSADPHEMLHYVALYLGLHCLSKYLFRGFWYTQRVKIGAFLSVLHLIMVYI